MGQIRDMLLGIRAELAANDDEITEIRVSLDQLEARIVDARNRVVHCQAELHAAEMQLETAQQQLRETLRERRLLPDA